jgi:ElaB/YqjD/DUF883 family membrane-anchored ribosome-binding protein
MAKPRVTAEQFQEKHARRTKAALEDMRAGIEGVTEAPGAKAAQKADKMRQKLLEALDSGKWARRVGSVSLEDWKKQMLEKGVARVPAGIDGAADKVTAFAGQLLTHEEKLMAEVDKMPDLTLEDSVARATAWIRGMSKFEYKR